MFCLKVVHRQNKNRSFLYNESPASGSERFPFPLNTTKEELVQRSFIPQHAETPHSTDKRSPVILGLSALKERERLLL